MAKEIYIQIGVTALRTPTGDFLPSVPIYIKSSEAADADGLTQAEKAPLHDIAALFAIKHIEHNSKAAAGKARDGIKNT